LNDVLKTLRPRIIFMLDENLAMIFSHQGPWIMGHMVQTKDLPWDLPGDNRFIIANSRTGVVFGPFIQTRPQYQYRTGVEFMRKEQGTPRVYPVLCHWLAPFDQLTPYYKITCGVEWKEIAELIGVDENEWWHLRRLQLTDEQFKAICQKLENFNSSPDTQALYGFEIFSQTQNELDHLAYEMAVSSDTEDEGSPEYWESWVRDTFFDGNARLEAAFWDSYDPD